MGPSTVTVTGPTPSSKMNVCRAGSERARTAAVPTVGWPANGSSWFGVKILTWKLRVGSRGGRTKVVSEKLNSRASCCRVCSSMPSAFGNTASWFPPNGRSLNTSTRAKL